MNSVQIFPKIDLEYYKSLGKELGTEDIESITEISQQPNKCYYKVIRDLQNDSVPKINYMFANYEVIKNLSQRELCEYFLARDATNITFSAKDENSLGLMKTIVEAWNDKNKVFDDFNEKWGIIGMDVVDEVDKEGVDHVFVMSISRNYEEFKKNGLSKVVQEDFEKVRKFFIGDLMKFVEYFMNYTEPLMMMLSANYMAHTKRADPGEFEMDIVIEFVSEDDERLIEQTRKFDECKNAQNNDELEALYCDMGNNTNITYLDNEKRNEILELLEKDLNRKSALKSLGFFLKNLQSDDIGKALQFELNYVFPNLNLKYFENVDDVIRKESISSKLIEALEKEGIKVDVMDMDIEGDVVSEGESEE